ncbi:hypothetical protein JCM1841_006789 [Sporobolomyces salmonicolor]
MTAAAFQPTSTELPSSLASAQSSAPGRAIASDYCLDVRQQPRQARMAGSGEKADRRPIDPPPIIRLRLRKPAARKKPSSALTDADLVAPTLTHTLFMFASLVPADSEDEMYDLTGSKSKHVAGSVVSSLFHLKDQSCFVFPDLSVRTEGRWRFKMSMYKIVEDGVHFCDSILTDVFQVYSSKRFPGMGKSTELSKSFAQQGLKLRIRRPGSKNEDEEDLTPPRRNRISPLVTHRPTASSTADFQPPPPPPVATQHERRTSGPSASSYYPPLPSSSSSASASACRKRPWSSRGADSPASTSRHPTPNPHGHGYAPYPPQSALSRPTRSVSHYNPSQPDQRRLAHLHEHPRRSSYNASNAPSYSPPSSYTSSFPPPAPSTGYSAAPRHYGPLPPSNAYSRPSSPQHSHSYLPPPGSLALHVAAHAHHQPARSPPRPSSPPLMLAPIRSTLPTPASSRPGSNVTGSSPEVPNSSVSSKRWAACATYGAVKQTESSVRTGSNSDDVRHVANRGATGEQQGSGPSSTGSRGSLAMLLGEGAQNAKEPAGGEGVAFF